MAEAVNSHGEAAGQPPKSPDEVAMGFIKVANETMCRPIRALTQMRVRLITPIAVHDLFYMKCVSERQV